MGMENDEDESKGVRGDVMTEANRFGLRALSKARWDELEKEYKEYKKRLLEQAADSASASGPGYSTRNIKRQDGEDRAAYDHHRDHRHERHQNWDNHTSHQRGDRRDRRHDYEEEVEEEQSQEAPSYPPRCLLFVKNIDPETNKTTLKVLLGRAFGKGKGSKGGEIDYVDFSKGLDSVGIFHHLADCMHSSMTLCLFQF
jgi:hypothetical protein